MEDYNNEVEIIVNSFKAEYHECGSHQIKLTLDIDKEEMKEFLKAIKK